MEEVKECQKYEKELPRDYRGVMQVKPARRPLVIECDFH